jgi:hypothetical protein
MSRADRLVSHDMPQIFSGIANDELLRSSPAFQREFVSIDTMLPPQDIFALSGYSKVWARR